MQFTVVFVFLQLARQVGAATLMDTGPSAESKDPGGTPHIASPQPLLRREYGERSPPISLAENDHDDDDDDERGGQASPQGNIAHSIDGSSNPDDKEGKLKDEKEDEEDRQWVQHARLGSNKVDGGQPTKVPAESLVTIASASPASPATNARGDMEEEVDGSAIAEWQDAGSGEVPAKLSSKEPPANQRGAYGSHDVDQHSLQKLPSEAGHQKVARRQQQPSSLPMSLTQDAKKGKKMPGHIDHNDLDDDGDNLFAKWHPEDQRQKEQDELQRGFGSSRGEDAEDEMMRAGLPPALAAAAMRLDKVQPSAIAADMQHLESPKAAERVLKHLDKATTQLAHLGGEEAVIVTDSEGNKHTRAHPHNSHDFSSRTLTEKNPNAAAIQAELAAFRERRNHEIEEQKQQIYELAAATAEEDRPMSLQERGGGEDDHQHDDHHKGFAAAAVAAGPPQSPRSKTVGNLFHTDASAGDSAAEEEVRLRIAQDPQWLERRKAMQHRKEIALKAQRFASGTLGVSNSRSHAAEEKSSRSISAPTEQRPPRAMAVEEGSAVQQSTEPSAEELHNREIAARAASSAAAAADEAANEVRRQRRAEKRRLRTALGEPAKEIRSGQPMRSLASAWLDSPSLLQGSPTSDTASAKGETRTASSSSEGKAGTGKPQQAAASTTATVTVAVPRPFPGEGADALQVMVALNGSATQNQSRPNVWCGGHGSFDCGGCTLDRGQTFCNGDCEWMHGSCQFRSDLVWCGTHTSRSCHFCTRHGMRDFGYTWCGGDCYWAYPGECKKRRTTPQTGWDKINWGQSHSWNPLNYDFATPSPSRGAGPKQSPLAKLPSVSKRPGATEALPDATPEPVGRPPAPYPPYLEPA